MLLTDRSKSVNSKPFKELGRRQVPPLRVSYGKPVLRWLRASPSVGRQDVVSASRKGLHSSFSLSTTYCLLTTGFINRQGTNLIGYFFDGFAGDVNYGPGGILLEDPVAVI